LSTNVGPGRPAIRSMSAAGTESMCGMETDALDTLELSDGGGRNRQGGGAEREGRGFSTSITINLIGP
jgi:hypothetical protein